MAISRHTFRHALPALLCGAFSLAAGPLASAVHATGSNVAGVAGTSVAGIAGVFDAGWSTAYYPQDSITHMHQRLHALGMDEVVLQYAAVEATHLYYPSQLDFLQNTQYKNNELFPKSIEAAKTAGTRIWLGLYYNGENWYTPPTAEQLDTLASRNLKVLEEIHSLYGSEAVVEGVYIPQEIARYYWDDLRDRFSRNSLPRDSSPTLSPCRTAWVQAMQASRMPKPRLWAATNARWLRPASNTG